MTQKTIVRTTFTSNGVACVSSRVPRPDALLAKVRAVRTLGRILERWTPVYVYADVPEMVQDQLRGDTPSQQQFSQRFKDMKGLSVFAAGHTMFRPEWGRQDRILLIQSNMADDDEWERTFLWQFSLMWQHQYQGMLWIDVASTWVHDKAMEQVKDWQQQLKERRLW